MLTKTKVIAVLGYKHSGKTTASKMILHILSKRQIGVPIEEITYKSYKLDKELYKFFNVADEGKRIASKMFDVSLTYFYKEGLKDIPIINMKTPRDMIKHVCESTIEFVNEKGYWARLLSNEIKKNNKSFSIIGDLRKPEEYEVFKENFQETGFKVIAIYRNGIYADKNASCEKNTDKVPFDYMIDNNGTYEDLFNSIKTALKEIGYVI